MFSVNHWAGYTGFWVWLGATILSRSAIFYNLHFLQSSRIVSPASSASQITT